MVLAVSGWGVREWLLLLYALVWSVVTILFAWRGVKIVESVGWWAGLPGGLGIIWRIWAPSPPGQGGE